MPSLKASLLGRFELTVDGMPAVPLSRTRLQSFVAFLLLHRRAPLLRSYVAFQFWPDSPEAQARNNLRKLLHQLRQSLPAIDSLLDADTQSIRWRDDVDVWLDVEEFEARLQADTRADLVSHLEAAVALYQGDLLPSCYDEWIELVRERLRQQFLAALGRSINLADEARDYAAAVQHAQRLLRYEPLHETTYRQLMRLHAQMGDRAAALATYHTCVNLLRRELDVEPSQETQQLHAQILSHGALAAPALTAGAPVQTVLHLVGRREAWQKLRGAWEKLAPGRRHFCLIRGEAGIGKTRLAEELAAWIERQGIPVAVARAYPGRDALAYAPLIELLRGKSMQPALESLHDVWLRELARLLPEIPVARPDLRGVDPLTDRERRQRLFEAAARVCVAAPDRRQTARLVFLDDLHWYDADTLEWLHYLLNFVPVADTRLLVVGTARADEVDGDHPLQRLLFDLRRTGLVTEIDLPPLDAEESIQLAQQVARTSLAPDAALAVYAQTEGNPLFIVETMRAGIATGQVTATRAVPAKVQAVVEYRLARLSPAARATAQLAAVIGRAFDFSLLQQASDQSEDALVNCLDELWQRGIVREQGDARYDFSHDRIREVAYASISPMRRRSLHCRVAAALERTFAAGTRPVSAQIAGHYALADMRKQAIPYYHQAAEEAVARYDHRSAVAWLEQELVLLRGLPQTSETVLREFTALQAQIQSLSVVEGFTTPAIGRICRRLEELLPQIEDESLRVQAYRRLGGYSNIGGKSADAYRYLEACLDLAHRHDDPELLAGIYQFSGVLNLLVGRLTLARASMEHALTLEREMLESGQSISNSVGTSLVSVRGNLALTLLLLGYPEQAFRSGQTAIAEGERVGEPFSLAVGLYFAALTYQVARTPHRMAAPLQYLLDIDARYGFPINTASGKVMQGWLLAHNGDPQTGMQLMRSGIDEVNAMHHVMLQTHRLAQLAEVQIDAGCWEEVAVSLDEGFSLAESSGQHGADAELLRLRGEWLIQAPHPTAARLAEAEAALQRALAVAQAQAAKSYELRTAITLGRLWRDQGKQDAAYALLSPLYTWFTEGFDTPDLVAAQSLLAELREIHA